VSSGSVANVEFWQRHCQVDQTAPFSITTQSGPAICSPPWRPPRAFRHFLRCKHHGRLALAHGGHHQPGQQRRSRARERDHRSHCTVSSGSVANVGFGN
jgi:hypothetical protein